MRRRVGTAPIRVRGGSSGSSLFGVRRPLNLRCGQVATGRLDVTLHNVVWSQLLHEPPAMSVQKRRDLLGLQPEPPQLPALTKPAIQPFGAVEGDAIDEIPPDIGEYQ